MLRKLLIVLMMMLFMLLMVLIMMLLMLTKMTRKKDLWSDIDLASIPSFIFCSHTNSHWWKELKEVMLSCSLSANLLIAVPIMIMMIYDCDPSDQKAREILSLR